MSRDFPYLPFFAADWLSDERLRMVSLAAHGLWIGLLCYAHRAERRGYVEIERGKPISDDMLARLFATSPREISKIKSELLSAGVPSIEAGTGVWFSRRMVRDEERRHVNSANGRRGGNPALKSNRLSESDNRDRLSSDNREGDGLDNLNTSGDEGRVNLSLFAESESEKSNSETKRVQRRGGVADLPFRSEEFAAAWADFDRHRREKRTPLTPTATKRLLAKLAGWGEVRAIEAMRHSLSNGWTGIFEPTASRNGADCGHEQSRRFANVL